ncbi:SagB/ThcOx family dehydrogenase [Candidatus Saccharibacteria bacterium]|nr:SagB/ThcOx family dehydrogenase [Candidatus Saccharibacteria bacterium]
MEDDELYFDKFWEASSLDKFNLEQFAQSLNTYDSDDKELTLELPIKPVSIPISSSATNKIAKKRKSSREFSNRELSIKNLGRVLSSFYAWNGLEHRAYPSAGATYVNEIFCVAFNVENYSGKIIYYDPELHGITIVKDNAISWAEAKDKLNMNIEGEPNLLVIFVSFTERVLSKYGERGGRFALLEIGAALQQLSLQVAESKRLKGVAVGGMLDNFWKRELKLDRTDAHITIGYLVGQ